MHFFNFITNLINFRKAIRYFSNCFCFLQQFSFNGLISFDQAIFQFNFTFTLQKAFIYYSYFESYLWLVLIINYKRGYFDYAGEIDPNPDVFPLN